MHLSQSVAGVWRFAKALYARPAGSWLRRTASALGLVAALSAAGPAAAQDTIKVGILHSLSGTMAISETTLKDTILFLIEEQNKKGGVLGKKLEAVVVDPASNWPLFAEKAQELIVRHKVSVVFGGWTSVSRKSVLPVFKELNSILFYPVQYEGEESERNVFYTGAVPNQSALPAVHYLMNDEKVQRWVLAGTDYVYPRTTNRIIESYLKSKGVRAEDIMFNYTPFGHADWQTIVADIKKFASAGKKTAVISTINGDANIPFYKELGNQGIKANGIPVLALSVGEEELAGIDTKPLVGHLAAANYFQSIKAPANEAFVARWRAFTKNPRRVTNDPMEAHVIGFNMWVKAVEKAGSIDPNRVIAALPGIQVPNLTGGIAEMLPNHHVTKPVFIGEIKANGQFDVVWKTANLVEADAWSQQLDGSKNIVADWRAPANCGRINIVSKQCLDGSHPRPVTVAARPAAEYPQGDAASRLMLSSQQPNPAPLTAAPPAVSAPAPVAVVPPPAVSPPPQQQAALPPPVQPASPALPAAKSDPGRRVALVIGNSAYKNTAPLTNPSRDAAAVAKAFRDLGFQKVSVELNLSREKMFDTLRQFASDTEKADWAVVYFAGHGIEMGGVNYLIPIDAKLQTDRDVDFEAVPIERVMSAVDGAKKLRLVLLDACRDNPFANQMRRTVATRSIGRGFAQVEPEAGTLVVYAAKHGQTALDGTDGGNSPFVTALVNRMQVPGLEIRRLFDVVRDDVMASTSRRQQPFSYGSVSGSEDFFFVAKQ